jgi:hypothetical protein
MMDETLSRQTFWKVSSSVPSLLSMVVVAMLAATISATAQIQPDPNAFEQNSENQAGKINSEAAEFVAPLIGAPVMYPDGTQLGEVADILFDEEGLPAKLRMRVGAPLGLGQRTVELPKGSFMLLRGAVVVDLPVEAVRSLPDAAYFTDKE